ncbi:uncharacterized protein LOC130940061 [Arachis stenosperma]|uniref:uncharacterized protein LOC130940061 n=1 Tax=Arachis stenosperma TaxID=217475 RepID=UPI0025ACFEBB|nr:uncharacterized protein LOC130940061 [Arachis stenosperma]
MEFGLKWRAWIKECVCTASMSVLINGSPSKPFNMERGLRQGDHLSPFLFVLVVDVLHRMIGEAVRNGRISPLLVGRDDNELSHLLSINFEKSSFIPVNCEQRWTRKMCTLLDCKEASLPVRGWGVWDTACEMGSSDGSKKAGGLEVGDVVTRNAVLFFKWWWRFSKEECPLWKKVVCSCNHMNSSEMLSAQPVPTRGGPLKDIFLLQITEPWVREKIISGFCMNLENGSTIRGLWVLGWDRVGLDFSMEKRVVPMGVGACTPTS